MAPAACSTRPEPTTDLELLADRVMADADEGRDPWTWCVLTTELAAVLTRRGGVARARRAFQAGPPRSFLQEALVDSSAVVAPPERPAPDVPLGLVRFLQRVHESEDQEVVYERGGGWWIGEDPTTGFWPRRALQAGVIGPTQDTEVGRGLERYVLNEDGRKLLENPKHVPQLVAHLRATRRP